MRESKLNSMLSNAVAWMDITKISNETMDGNKSNGLESHKETTRYRAATAMNTKLAIRKLPHAIKEMLIIMKRTMLKYDRSKFRRIVASNTSNVPAIPKVKAVNPVSKKDTEPAMGNSMSAKPEYLRGVP